MDIFYKTYYFIKYHDYTVKKFLNYILATYKTIIKYH